MRIRYVIAGLMLFLLFLLLQIPAALVAPLLKKHSNGVIELSAADGTVWHGQASALLLRGSPVLAPLQWRLNPWALLLLQLRGEISSKNGHATFALSSDRLAFSAERLELPLSLLAQLDASMSHYQLRGRAELQTERFVFAREGGEGQLRVRLLELGSGLVAVPSIGQYRIQISPVRDAYRFSAETEYGPLRVAGEGRWQPGKGGSIRLQLHPEAQAEALLPLLSLAGRPAASGDYYLNTSFR